VQLAARPRAAAIARPWIAADPERSVYQGRAHPTVLNNLLVQLRS